MIDKSNDTESENFRKRSAPPTKIARFRGTHSHTGAGATFVGEQREARMKQRIEYAICTLTLPFRVTHGRANPHRAQSWRPRPAQSASIEQMHRSRRGSVRTLAQEGWQYSSSLSFQIGATKDPESKQDTLDFRELKKSAPSQLSHAHAYFTATQGQRGFARPSQNRVQARVLCFLKLAALRFEKLHR